MPIVWTGYTNGWPSRAMRSQRSRSRSPTYPSRYGASSRASTASSGATPSPRSARWRTPTWRRLGAGRAPPVGLDLRLSHIQVAREELFRDTSTRKDAPTLDEVNALVLAAIYELRILQFLAARREADGPAVTDTAYARQYVARLKDWSDRLLRLSEANTLLIRANLKKLDLLRDDLSDSLDGVRRHFPYLLRDGSIDLSVLDDEHGASLGQCHEGYQIWTWVKGPNESMRTMVQMGQAFGYNEASSRTLANEQQSLTNFLLAVAQQAEAAMSLNAISQFMHLMTGEPTLAPDEVQDTRAQLAQLRTSVHRNSRRMQSWRSIIGTGLRHGPFALESRVVTPAWVGVGSGPWQQCPLNRQATTNADNPAARQG